MIASGYLSFMSWYCFMAGVSFSVKISPLGVAGRRRRKGY